MDGSCDCANLRSIICNASIRQFDSDRRLSKPQALRASKFEAFLHPETLFGKVLSVLFRTFSLERRAHWQGSPVILPHDLMTFLPHTPVGGTLNLPG